jgi:hypothetical protein
MSGQIPSHNHISSQRSSAPPSYQSCHDNVVLLRAELKITADERDVLRREVDKLQSRLEAVHGYDLLNSQCTSMMNELESLQRQHTELVFTNNPVFGLTSDF